MRDFAKISPQFWINKQGREIKKLGLEAQLVSFYLITNPHSTMLGIYYLPIPFMSHEMGMSHEAATNALQSLCEIGFCTYDSDSEYVWVHEMAFDQIDDQLKVGDHRVKGIHNSYAALPQLPFLQAFHEKYAQAFLLGDMHHFLSATEAPSKALRSKEKEKEQKNEKEKEQEQMEDAEIKNISAHEKNKKPILTLLSLSPSEQTDSTSTEDKTFSTDSGTIITVPLQDNTEFPITQEMIDEWQKLYPEVDVIQTVRHIRGWNLANAKKRKTKSGILKHINHWLANAEDNNKRHSRSTSPNTLFTHNQGIATEWLQKDRISH